MRLLPRSRRLRKAFGITIAGLLALVLAGAAYQAWCVHRERARFPPPGRLVDVGGRLVHVICLGEGSPTVIFEPSMFGGSASSRLAREEIAARTRVCAYDRMGMGWSEPGPVVITVGLLTADLERLLDRADIRGPYVLVPSSIGGLTAELFARRHPDRVAGIVFLDAAQSDALRAIAGNLTSTSRIGARLAACVPKAAVAVGLLRLADPFGLRAEGNARAIAGLYTTGAMNTLCGMMRGLPATLDEFGSAPPLRGDLPLVVLSAESTKNLVPPALASMAESFVADRIPLAQAFARRSTRGSWQIVPGSDHLIGNSQPHAVARAVLDLPNVLRREPR